MRKKYKILLISICSFKKYGPIHRCQPWVLNHPPGPPHSHAYTYMLHKNSHHSKWSSGADHRAGCREGVFVIFYPPYSMPFCPFCGVHPSAQDFRFCDLSATDCCTTSSFSLYSKSSVYFSPTSSMNLLIRNRFLIFGNLGKSSS